MITEVVRVRPAQGFPSFVVENPFFNIDGCLYGDAVYIEQYDGEWCGPYRKYIDLKKMKEYSIEYCDVKTWEKFCQENFTVGAN